MPSFLGGVRPYKLFDIILTSTITDKDGKTVKVTKQKCHSFVSNFLNQVFAFWNASSTVSVKDTAGASQTIISTTSATPTVVWYFQGGSAATYGIVVGSSNTTPTISDYKLTIQIANGTGSGQLTHQTGNIIAPVISGGTISFTASRSFLNQSGATITALETGIYITTYITGSTPINLMILHDLFASPQTILATQTLTVTYTISTTV